jgi:hypothetical protein
MGWGRIAMSHMVMIVLRSERRGYRKGVDGGIRRNLRLDLILWLAVDSELVINGETGDATFKTQNNCIWTVYGHNKLCHEFDVK